MRIIEHRNEHVGLLCSLKFELTRRDTSLETPKGITKLSLLVHSLKQRYGRPWVNCKSTKGLGRPATRGKPTRYWKFWKRHTCWINDHRSKRPRYHCDPDIGRDDYLEGNAGQFETRGLVEGGRVRLEPPRY